MEHLDTGNDGGDLLIGQTDDLNGIVDLQSTSLHTTGGNSTTTGNGEDVLDRHQEGLISLTVGRGNIAIHSVHQLQDGSILGRVDVLAGGLQSHTGRTADDRNIVSGEVVGRQQLADFHLDQIQQLLIVNQVSLVHEHDDSRHADLTGKQHVLTGLSERAIGSSHDQDSAVHLSGTGDHVLDVVSVTGAVDVRVVALVGLVLNVTGVDCDTACLLLGRVIDLVISQELVLAVLQRQNLGDSGSQSGLTVVNVTDGTNVDMGLGTLECSLCHCNNPPLLYFFVLLGKSQVCGQACALPRALTISS